LPPRGLQNASNSDFSYILSSRFRSNSIVCSWSSECSKWCRLLYWPPLRKMGGGVFFVKICTFELSLGPYFLSDFGFSHIKIITATYPTQSCAFPPFWVSPFFCTNLQNRWIYLLNGVMCLVGCGGRIWRVISDPTKFYENTPWCVYVKVVWWAQRNFKYPKSWPKNGAKKETYKLDINGVKI